MTQKRLSRRSFLRSSADAARGSCIVLTVPMILTACNRSEETRQEVSAGDSDDNSSSLFATLSQEEVLEFQAITARIIPSDATPGAAEAGVIYFIDTVLADNREAEYLLLQEGLRELQTLAAINFSAAYFYELEEVQQDQLLTEIETTEFFATIRYLTIAGMFALPDYGGNRDNIGYQLIGFEDRHAWQAPYGFYDADYAEKGE